MERYELLERRDHQVGIIIDANWPLPYGLRVCTKRSYPESQEAECLKTSQRELQDKKDKIMWKIISNLKSIQAINMIRE